MNNVEVILRHIFYQIELQVRYTFFIGIEPFLRSLLHFFNGMKERFSANVRSMQLHYLLSEKLIFQRRFSHLCGFTVLNASRD